MAAGGLAFPAADVFIEHRPAVDLGVPHESGVTLEIQVDVALEKQRTRQPVARFEDQLAAGGASIDRSLKRASVVRASITCRAQLAHSQLLSARRSLHAQCLGRGLAPRDFVRSRRQKAFEREHVASAFVADPSIDAHAVAGGRCERRAVADLEGRAACAQAEELERHGAPLADHALERAVHVLEQARASLRDVDAPVAQLLEDVDESVAHARDARR